MRRAIVAGLLPALLVFLAWHFSGVPIFQRGFWAMLAYLTILVAFGLGFFFETQIQDAIETIRRERPPAEPEEGPLIPGVQPGDKSRMRTAVLQGVLEAIKGLVHRSDEAERRLKELEHRMSELSLAAGLKPRTAARAVAEQKAP